MLPEYRFVKATENMVEVFNTGLINGSSHFRYYKTRPTSTIRQHLVTSFIINTSGIPVAYGHLEKENGVLWLGIAVADSQTNKGLGKLMMQHLVNAAVENDETAICLSVDKDNQIAQKLYGNFGFVQTNELNDRLIFELILN